MSSISTNFLFPEIKTFQDSAFKLKKRLFNEIKIIAGMRFNENLSLINQYLQAEEIGFRALECYSRELNIYANRYFPGNSQINLLKELIIDDFSSKTLDGWINVIADILIGENSK